MSLTADGLEAPSQEPAKEAVATETNLNTNSGKDRTGTYMYMYICIVRHYILFCTLCVGTFLYVHVQYNVLHRTTGVIVFKVPILSYCMYCTACMYISTVHMCIQDTCLYLHVHLVIP